MKAAEIREFGIDKIALVDRPEPKPGSSDVIVRMKAASLNFRDLMVARGEYNPRLRMPMVPLSDGSGEVVDTGAAVSRVKVGDRVAGIFMSKWIDGELDEEKSRSALGGGIDGVAAEYVLFHQDAVVPIPEHLSYEEAATLPCTGVTAWNAIVTSGKVRPDDWVLTLGTGGVSLYALQFAKLMGALVIATSGSDEKLDKVRRLGADETINYRTVPDWEKRVREITGGRGADNVVEVGGGETLPRSLKAVRMGGVISLIGVLSGKSDVNFVPVFMRNIRMQGLFVGSREMFEDMNRTITAHQLKPVVDRVFPFEGLREAMHHMEAGTHFGKLCISFP